MNRVLIFPSSLFLLLLVAAVSGQPLATTDCQPVYDTISAALKALNKPVYNTAQFSKGCVAATCQGLASAPCPYLSGSTTKARNATALQIDLGILTSCLQAQTSICSTPLQDIALSCATGITMQALFGSSNITGNITLVPGTGSVSGLPDVMMTYDPTTDTFVVNVTLVYQGQAEAYIGIPDGNNKFLHIPNVPVKVSLMLGLVLAIDPTNTADPVTVVSSSVSKQAEIGDLSLGDGNQQNQAQLSGALASAFNQTVQGSTLPNDVGMFLGDIMADACLTAEANCAM